MREIDELRGLTAGRLLELWQACRRDSEDPLERTLRCNAAILAECCRFQGRRVYEDGGEVLAEMTGREMEGLLRRLAGDEPAPSGDENAAFLQERFEELRRG